MKGRWGTTVRSWKRVSIPWGAVTVVIGILMVYSFVKKFEIIVRSRVAYDEEVSLFPSKVVEGNKQNSAHQKSFLELALEVKTSKVTEHKYQCMYEDALAPYRNIKGLKILEIGLGCDMPYPPGASYYIWSNYFLDPRITFFDFNKYCAQKWHAELAQNITNTGGDQSKLPKMFYGDELNPEDLQKMADVDGPWDIIIDDGNHLCQYQISALTNLFKDVKPGGTYFSEDLLLWDGQRRNLTLLKITELYILSIYETFRKDLLNIDVKDWKTPGLGNKVDRITCCTSICGIRVKNI